MVIGCDGGVTSSYTFSKVPAVVLIAPGKSVCRITGASYGTDLDVLFVAAGMIALKIQSGKDRGRGLCIFRQIHDGIKIETFSIFHPCPDPDLFPDGCIVKILLTCLL